MMTQSTPHAPSRDVSIESEVASMPRGFSPFSEPSEKQWGLLEYFRTKRHLDDMGLDAEARRVIGSPLTVLTRREMTVLIDHLASDVVDIVPEEVPMR